MTDYRIIKDAKGIEALDPDTALLDWAGSINLARDYYQPDGKVSDFDELYPAVVLADAERVRAAREAVRWKP